MTEEEQAHGEGCERRLEAQGAVGKALRALSDGRRKLQRHMLSGEREKGEKEEGGKSKSPPHFFLAVAELLCLGRK